MYGDFDDDDVYMAAANRMASRQPLHFYSSNNYEDPPEQQQPLRDLFRRFLRLFAGPNLGVLVAIGVIVLVQYRGWFWGWYYIIREEGLKATLIELAFNLLDLLRAYYQIGLELLRSFRQVIGLHSDPGAVENGVVRGAGRLAGGPPPLYTPAAAEEADAQEVHDDSSSNKHTASSTRNVQRRNQAANGELKNTSTSQRGVPETSRDEIEPAFLHEQDYPPGWLVYHPTLGVVTKEEADKYNHSKQSSGGAVECAG